MSKWEMIRTIFSMFVLDGLTNAGIVLWARYDTRLSSPFLYFVMLTVINLFAVFLAFLQLYFYQHPEPEEEQEQ